VQNLDLSDFKGSYLISGYKLKICNTSSLYQWSQWLIFLHITFKKEYLNISLKLIFIAFCPAGLPYTFPWWKVTKINGSGTQWPITVQRLNRLNSFVPHSNSILFLTPFSPMGPHLRCRGQK